MTGKDAGYKDEEPSKKEKGLMERGIRRLNGN